METRCEFAVKYLFPIIRAEISRILIRKHKLTQIEVAEKLGITQAAVSQYLNEKRGRHMESLPTNIQDIIKKSLNELDNIDVKALDSENVKNIVCDICNKIKKIKKF
ncbi:MAG: transcriptional regulator [Candidatus Odinarchaeia archaeon]